MFIDSGPGLAVILVGSLLVMLLIGSIVIVTYRRCRHHVKRVDGNAISSPESAASNQNEPISPVTIYYGETSFQPRQLTRGHNESVAPDLQHQNSTTKVTFAPGNPHSPPHSADPGRKVADKPRESMAEFTKSLATTAAANRVPPRHSLESAIQEDLREERFSTAPAICGHSEGGSSARRASGGNECSRGHRIENKASSSEATAFPMDKYVESPRRSSALTAGGTFPGMQRPLPLPPTAFAGSRLGSSEGSTGYADEVDSFGAFVFDGHQGRRVSSTSQMSLPATALRRQLANDGRHLPRTSWSGPTIQMPSL